MNYSVLFVSTIIKTSPHNLSTYIINTKTPPTAQLDTFRNNGVAINQERWRSVTNALRQEALVFLLE
jgi:hypothetical protein